MVDRLLHDRRGVPEMLLQLLAPAARHLGQLWDQDRLSFSQVTLGLLRMQNMTHHYSSLSRRAFHRAGPKFRAMVAAAPGSQHLLGLPMVSEFFVNDGNLRGRVRCQKGSVIIAAGGYFEGSSRPIT
jgi:MerR family transcriptional regulator, light-induced transcriptional regulator